MIGVKLRPKKGKKKKVKKSFERGGETQGTFQAFLKLGKNGETDSTFRFGGGGSFFLGFKFGFSLIFLKKGALLGFPFSY